MAKKKKTVRKSTKKSVNNSKHLHLIVIAIAVVLLAITIALFIILSPSDDALENLGENDSHNMNEEHGMSTHIAATANGEPITIGEMQMAMDRFRVETIMFFHTMHDLEFGRDFWDTEVAGTTPHEHVRNLALDFLAEKKIQQQFFRDNGIIGDFSYASFMRQLAEENMRREQTIAEGGVIFGVQHFDAITYYEFLFVNQVQAFLNEMGDDFFAITHADLIEFHERNIQNFRTPNEVVVDVIVVSQDYGDEQYARILEAQTALNEGATFYSVMEEFNPGGAPIQIDLSGRRARVMGNEFLNVAFALTEDEVSDIFESQNDLFIIRSALRIEGYYRGIEGREHAIRTEVLWERYEVFVEQLIADAIIEINESVFNHIYMEV